MAVEGLIQLQEEREDLLAEEEEGIGGEEEEDPGGGKGDAGGGGGGGEGRPPLCFLGTGGAVVLTLPVDLTAPFRAITEIGFDLAAEIVGIDHDLIEAMLLEEEDQVLHNGAVDDRYERLGDIASQRVEARPDSCRQYHRFHLR